MVEDDWGVAVDPHKAEAALKANPDAKVLAFVHAETSTGAISDAKTLAEIARQHGCLVIADTVTSLAGSPLMVDDWKLDAVYSGTQKCLSCVPGLSPVTFSQKAIDVITSRKTKVQSWFLDLNLILGYWGGGAKRAYHHTAPVNTLYGLHEALVILQEEGIENSWARHQKNHLALRAGIEAMGLSFVVPEGQRLPQLNAVSIPDGIDEAAVRAALLSEYNLEIGAGLGAMAGKIWRIGLMGFASNTTNVLFCLGALDAVLGSMKAPISTGVAVDAARASYN
jgi:alanine-glyoxylate transaminase/serine-glyoxylate transaminase/serine-pyruvate transaminase